MKRKFDYFDRARIPDIILCKPNNEEICFISDARERNLELNLTSMSEFHFEVSKIKDSPQEYYNKLEVRKRIKLVDYGVFEITSIEIETEGELEYKKVSCRSTECDFIKRSLTEFTGTYSFYNPLNPSKSLLTELLTYVPNWSIGEVDSDLWEIYRTFNITDMSIYDFMMNEVAKSYECIFVFNTFNNTVNAYHYKNYVKTTDIYMSFDNLLKTINQSVTDDELITCLDVRGADGVNIRSVNPTGDNKIYNFTYFMDKDKEWLDASLIDKINSWQKLIDSEQQNYLKLVIEQRVKIENNTKLKSELYDLEQKLKSLEEIKSSQIAQGIPLGDINSQINAQNSLISSKNSQITINNSELDSIKAQRLAINNKLKFENNFNANEIKSLNSIIVGSTFIDDTFIYTDIMKDEEKQDVCLDLYKHAVNVLNRNSVPRISFSIKAVNYLNIREFLPFIEETELGKQFTLELNKKVFAYPILQGIKLDFDDPTNLELIFDSKLNFDKSFLGSFEDVILGANSASISVDFDGYKWDRGEQAHSDFKDYKNSALDLTTQEIISASGQCPEITSAGILGLKKDENGSVDPKQYRLTNNVLAFSKDGFKTSSLGIGEIHLPDGSKAYGLIGEALIGNILIGEQLLIQNQNLSFRVDGEGVYLKNANIIMSSGDKDFTLEDMFSNVEANASADLSNAIKDINDNMGNMKEAIEDGMIEIFYQNTKPTHYKVGDMWYDTTIVNGVKKNEAWLAIESNGVLTWEKIKDSDVTKALADAQSAQTTADGKITTYYQNDEPKGTVEKPLGEGDLWVDTNDGNKLYRYNNNTKKWVNVQDKGISDAISSATDASNKVNGVLTQQGLLDTGKLQGSILAGSNNIFCVNTVNSKALLMNDTGILIANSKNAQGGWAWRTAISADGVSGDVIQGGTISGVTVVAGDVNGIHTVLNGSDPFRVYRNNNNNAVAEIWGHTSGSGGYLKIYGWNEKFGDTASFTIDAGGGNGTIRNYGELEISVRDGGDSGFPPYLSIDAWSGFKAYAKGQFNAPCFGVYCPSSGSSISYGWVDIGRTGWDVDCYGNFAVRGSKQAVVSTEHYGYRSLYCDESDKLYFTTKGLEETHLTSDGKYQTILRIDNIFLETIEPNSICPYIINISPYSNTSVWVKETYDKYVIIESENTTKFAYQINCIRKGYKDTYLEPSTIKERK